MDKGTPAGKRCCPTAPWLARARAKEVSRKSLTGMALEDTMQLDSRYNSMEEGGGKSGILPLHIALHHDSTNTHHAIQILGSGRMEIDCLWRIVRTITLETPTGVQPYKCG